MSVLNSVVLCFLASCIAFPSVVFSQTNEFKPYTQKLPNVEMGIEMVPIIAGEFIMGSPESEEGRKKDEGPQVNVKLDAFWIGKYEIPWDIYELFIFESGDVTKPGSQAASVDAVTRPTPPFLDMTFGMGKEGHPAVGMTQYNAIQFCKWLYSRTGIFYRLPTEAEWEYACRAGTATAYFFGNDEKDLGDYAWYSVNSGNKTQKLGQKKPNPWGLHDILGNALEWTIDQYHPAFYTQGKDKTRINPVAEPRELYPHSVRGGSFEDAASNLRSASRRGSDPSWKETDPQTPKSNWWFPSVPFVGLRIVRPAATPGAAEIQEYYNREPITEY